MPDNGDLRGSAPVYSTKDILQGLDRKVDELAKEVAVLVTDTKILGSQNLDARLNIIEQWQDRLIGLASVGALLGLLATVLALVNSLPKTATP